MTLFAVHLSDGAMSDLWVGLGFAGALLLLLPAMWRVREDEVPRIGLMTAAFFVASSIHFKIAITSVHLILNGLVGVLLGRRAPLAVSVGLVLQFLLLSHGGITTLGLNACVIGVPAVLAGMVYPLLRKLPAGLRGAIVGGGAVALAVGLNFAVLLFGGKEDWQTLARLVLLAHLPVVVVEALVLAVVVSYLEKVKPEMLRHAPSPGGNTSSNGISH